MGDYLPEFRNPIIVDKAAAQEASFKPAKTAVTLKHLLNFTSGLFYPGITTAASNMSKLDEAYSSKDMHRAEDPTSEFFRIVKVRSFPFFFLDSFF